MILMLKGISSTRVLSCKLHKVLHGSILVRRGATKNVRQSTTMLLQHWSNGGRRREMAERRVHTEDGGLDGSAEATTNIPPRLSTAIPPRPSGSYTCRRSPLEPAWPRRRQSRRQMSEPPPWSHQPPPLEWQRETLAETRFQEALHR